MAHFIKINKTTFSVSNSFVSAMTKQNLDFRVIVFKEKQLYLLDDSCLSSFTTSFTIVPATSQTHFFIEIGNSAKIRVNKRFFEFIVFCSKQGLSTVEKKENTKRPMLHSLDMFYTKPGLFVNLYNINEKALIPFLINLPVDGECSTHYFNSFSCNFNDFSFGNIPKSSLEQLFRDGIFLGDISRILKY